MVVKHKIKTYDILYVISYFDFDRDGYLSTCNKRVLSTSYSNYIDLKDIMTIVTWIGSVFWAIYFGQLIIRWATRRLSSRPSRDGRVSFTNKNVSTRSSERDRRTGVLPGGEYAAVLTDVCTRTTRLESKLDLITELKTANSKRT